MPTPPVMQKSFLSHQLESVSLSVHSLSVSRSVSQLSVSQSVSQSVKQSVSQSFCYLIALCITTSLFFNFFQFFPFLPFVFFLFIYVLLLLLFQVTIGLIKGKATHIVWPPKRWQRLENFTPEGRLAFGDNIPLSETENVTDTLSDSETETQTENSSSCRSYIDRDSTSVPEFMYGPTS